MTRRLAALLAGAALAACAHVQAPPGGPEDKEAPRLLTTRPDSLARVGAFTDPVVLVFDERLSEQNLRDAVQVSPRTSALEVDHRGDELRIRLRRGWEAGRIYQVSVGPTVQDLFNNRLGAPIQIVFSTGPEIPDTRLSGTVVSRTAGTPEIAIRVEAIRVQDSLVYTTQTDSSGAFLFRRIPEGPYRVRAFRDLNTDRVLQDYEARDTARAAVVAGASPSVALRVLQPDSTAPRIASVQPGDTVLEVRFDDYLDPAQPLTAAQVAVLLPDGSAVPVVRVEMRPGERAATGPPQPARPDSAAPAAAPAQGPAGPLPSQALTVRLGRPLPPDTDVVVRVRGVRNLQGLTGDAEGRVKTPRAPAAPPAAAPPPAAPPPGTRP
ncbi:MAG TPA: Ig-like domain-containing protein [Longimicrobiaceae bacterium]